jgi:hypothetical protein
LGIRIRHLTRRQRGTHTNRREHDINLTGGKPQRQHIRENFHGQRGRETAADANSTSEAQQSRL